MPELRRFLRAVAACSSAALLVALGSSAAAQSADAVVSFTFDDGSASQAAGAAVLDRHRLRGTFYISSGAIGTPGHLDRAQLGRIAAAGHEIGGHTVDHPGLTALAPDEARRQVCLDRANLVRWGFRVTSFTAPFDEYDGAVRRAVVECGYNSARIMGDLRSRRDCPSCPAAEDLPPEDPYAIRSPAMVTRTTTLQDLQESVRRAEAAGGGWVPLVLHRVCDGCGELAISPRVLDEFAAWLRQRGTPVRTVDEVVGGAAAPVHPGPPPPARDGPLNPSLELAGPGGMPFGWQAGGWGDNTPVWTRTRDARSGQWAQQLEITRHTGGDAKLLSTLDLGELAVPARPGQAYSLGVWYRSTARTEAAMYYRDTAGRWHYWAPGPEFAASEQWREARWSTPPVPDGASGISFGLALFSRGSVTTDDYAMRPDPAATERGECRRLAWWQPRRWLCW